jgi:hypothetical protein
MFKNNNTFSQAGEAMLLASEGQRELGMAIGFALSRLIRRIFARRITKPTFQ